MTDLLNIPVLHLRIVVHLVEPHQLVADCSLSFGWSHRSYLMLMCRCKDPCAGLLVSFQYLTWIL